MYTIAAKQARSGMARWRPGRSRQQRLYQRPQLIRHKLLGRSRHSDASCQTSPRGAKQRLRMRPPGAVEGLATLTAQRSASGSCR